MSSWRESDFRERDRKDRRRWIGRGIHVWAFVSLLILLNEQRRDGVRCDQDCYGTYRTYEAGHPWTNYSDSWQWDAQNALAAVAFIVAVIAALSLVGDRLRRAVVLTGVSWGFSAAWLIWNALSPAVGT